MDLKEREGNSCKIKQLEDTGYLEFADKNDPTDDEEIDPDPEDVNDQLSIPDDEDEEDDYDEDDNF
jgi:hypothetical protein